MAFSFQSIANFFLGSAAGVFNNNFQAVSDEFKKVFYRDGSAVAEADLDLNSHAIINAGAPRNSNSLPRVSDVLSYIAAAIARIPPAQKGDPGGNALAVGTFTAIGGMNILTGTDLIQTSGYSYFNKIGVGAARYTVGSTTDAPAPETAYSTNTKNGRPVYLAEPIRTIDMYGGIADGVEGTDSGTDNLPIIQAAIAHTASIGGGEIIFPALGGCYRISGPIVLPAGGGIRLVGTAGTQGGGSFILARGDQLFSTPTGFPIFNLRGMAFHGVRGVTDIIRRNEGGAWAYSEWENCYFANFKDFDTVILGVHIHHCNFANLRLWKLGGSDNNIHHNFGNYDVNDTTLGKNDIHISILAMGASVFEHNYITILARSGNDPIPLDVAICDTFWVTNNLLDGGSVCSLRVSNSSNKINVRGNRTSSLDKYSTTGYVPIVGAAAPHDVNVDSNICVGLESGAPFFQGGGGPYSVTNNITAANNDDDSDHDIDRAHSDLNAVITMRGQHIPNTVALPNGGVFLFSDLDRLLTNADATGNDNGASVNYITAKVKAGMSIRCCRTDMTRRWIIGVNGASGSVFDSDAHSTTQFFTLECLSDGTLTFNG